jgi:hypothetical protein
MMGLAEPPVRWDAETVTAALLETVRPAVGSEVDSMVIVDATHHGTVISSKDGCVLPRFQEAFRLGRVRSSTRRA